MSNLEAAKKNMLDWIEKAKGPKQPRLPKEVHHHLYHAALHHVSKNAAAKAQYRHTRIGHELIRDEHLEAAKGAMEKHGIKGFNRHFSAMLEHVKKTKRKAAPMSPFKPYGKGASKK